MKSRFKPIILLVFGILIFTSMFSGCGNKLSEDFDEEEVKKAAENVIEIINEEDGEALKNLCNVRMRDALTDDVLKKIFEAVNEGGEFQEIEDMSIAGATDKASEEEFAVVVVKAKYEIRKFTFTISFTKQMKLAGLYYR
ncbi:MAG: DUF3887 domain-containing protein [Clostridiaceae bacterium]|jgi:hypothetical protein|nr:DUF3887 domain-containing protein [Clostridiaceae bacterium]